MGSLLPSVGSGVELRSSGLATSIFTAFPSHQPIAVSSHSLCTEGTLRPRKMDRRSGWGSALVTVDRAWDRNVGGCALGSVWMGHPWSGRPFLSEGWECRPCYHVCHLHSALRVPVGTDPIGLLLQCARFLPPATETFTIDLGSFYYWPHHNLNT